MGKLSATAVKVATRLGRLGDGLFLVIQPGGGKRWMCREQKNCSRRDFGLGQRVQSLAGDRPGTGAGNPHLGRTRAGSDIRTVQGIPAFRQAAARVIAARSKTWRNEKHQKQWFQTLSSQCLQRADSKAASG